ncbi:hypothetical protein SELMODRAFT_432236 [Selaginella moellendorffii]|uniref:Uncharacterized protein n=1 Tax=Selaginella moellendorffii TaxID=88036 RepID=D8TFE1_SELML|nr:hypothetical protein SELMODRAFT_432236 [Selaginella moellendorffii]
MRLGILKSHALVAAVCSSKVCAALVQLKRGHHLQDLSAAKLFKCYTASIQFHATPIALSLMTTQGIANLVKLYNTQIGIKAGERERGEPQGAMQRAGKSMGYCKCCVHGAPSLIRSCLHFSVTVPVASKTVYMTAIENHKRLICVVLIDYPDSGSLYNTPDSGGKCGVPYRTYFRMPVQDIWYSMAISPVHFTVISTEHDWSLTREQMKSDLESVNRFSTPWIVFTGHRPMYSTQLWGIISKLYQVDLAVWGHVHNYERTCAVFQGHCLQHLQFTPWLAWPNSAWMTSLVM